MCSSCFKKFKPAGKVSGEQDDADVREGLNALIAYILSTKHKKRDKDRWVMFLVYTL